MCSSACPELPVFQMPLAQATGNSRNDLPTLNTGPYSHYKGLKTSGPILSGSLGMSPWRGDPQHSQEAGFLGQLRKGTKVPAMSWISGSQNQLGRRSYGVEFFKNTNPHHSTTRRNELLMHMTTWMNLKIITLDERSHAKAIYTIYLYKTLENAN